MPDTRELPRVDRVSYHDAVHAAAREIVGDPDRDGQVANEAARLAPLHRIQVAFDQLAAHADTHRAGGLGPYGHNFWGYARDELAAARRHAEVLKVAAVAAEVMLERKAGMLDALEAAMAKQRGDDPKLTTTGEDHPLQQGGYDPAADPGLPSNISDVEALKEGKTTKAQAEALAKADAAGDEGQEPAPSDEADMKPDAADAGIATPATTPKPTRTAADDDEPKRGGRKSK